MKFALILNKPYAFWLNERNELFLTMAYKQTPQSRILYYTKHIDSQKNILEKMNQFFLGFLTFTESFC